MNESIILITILSVVATVFMSSYVYNRFFKKGDEKTPETRSENEEILEELEELEEMIFENPLEKAEEKTAKIEETVQEVKERLNSIKSEDSEKPFANLSKPHVSEIPEELLASEKPGEGNLTGKPKRSKKRKPRVTQSEKNATPQPEKSVEPKKKRPYKKRAPRKNDEKNND